ncbi:hypothetical protein CHELA17_40345 [Chelatococcus asaccharovorans]|nr:hypothetical protein CHELA17_40345 [Chelatococcus asaccharovorans]
MPGTKWVGDRDVSAVRVSTDEGRNSGFSKRPLAHSQFAFLRDFARLNASNSAATRTIRWVRNRPAARRSDDRVTPVTVELTRRDTEA